MTEYRTNEAGYGGAERWRKTLLALPATLGQAVKTLDESAMQIALAVTDEGVLAGTITDGDIRRGLLRGLDMDSSVGEILYRDPIVVPPEMDRTMVSHLMRINKLRQIPVVDSRRRVIDLHLWEEMGTHSRRANTMVVMAGGAGSRLRPYTSECPKPLLRVAGKPMLEHILEKARTDGIERFVLAVHYLGHMIEEYFGDGRRWQVHIDYVRETSPLGTAGALSLLDPRPDNAILVSNSDVLTNIPYGEMIDYHERQRAFATMAVRQHEWRHPFGVVRVRGMDLVGLDEKPLCRSHVNAGVYVLSSAALDLLNPSEYCDMPDLFLRALDRNRKAIVYPIHESWTDVGTCTDYRQATETYEKKKRGKPDD